MNFNLQSLLCVFASLRLIFLFSPLWATSSPDTLETVASKTHPLFSSAHWGLYVIDAKTKETLYAHQADTLFIPASVAKLFSTAAALETLGPTHRFYTRVKTATLPDPSGTLEGNLYLVGGGDPTLTQEGLEDLARRVYAAGVRTLHGDVCIDDTLFNGSQLPPHVEWEDLTQDYAAEESALSINHNIVSITLTANQTDTGPATVTIDQPIPYCKLTHHVITDQTLAKAQDTVIRGLADSIIHITGSIPAKTKPIKRAVALHQPQEFARQLFKKLLEDQGIVITHRQKRAHAHPYELGSLASTPLSSIMAHTNQFSDNLASNLLLKAANLGKAHAIEALLTRAKVAPNTYLLCDGSGLSRHNCITPKQTVKLLDYMFHGPYQLEFIDTLAQPGSPGLLANRLKNDSSIHIHAKTGSMSGISNLAGFITLQDGRTLIFAFFINQSLYSSKETSDALDTLLGHLVKEARQRAARN